MPSVLEKKLTGLVGKEIVVVMADNRAFRGRLVEFDDATVLLSHVVEALPNNASGWEEPTASTGIVHKVITWKGVFSQEDNGADVVRLKDVLIRTSGVLRIWEWSLENTLQPEHVEKGAEEPEFAPGRKVSRRL